MTAVVSVVVGLGHAKGWTWGVRGFVAGVGMAAGAATSMAQVAQPSPGVLLPSLGDAPEAPSLPWEGGIHGGIRPQSVTGGFTVDTSSREASRVFYNTVYAASEGITQGWTGDVVNGVAGSNLQAFDDAVLRRINYYRAMAGIPAAVVPDSVYAAKAQQAALMMSANRQLSHTPPSTWTFYTAEGAEAAKNSNLALGYTGPAAIDGLIFDTGANNTPAGHRRWFLYPQTKRMGTGNVPASQGFPSSDATWVIDSSYGTSRPATRDEFVAWPPQGYVPYSLVPARWTFSHSTANFSSATVSMIRDGVPVPTRIESRQNGFGENTIVWIPGDLDPNSGSATPFPPPATPVGSTNVVIIDGVVLNGTTRRFTYSTVLFDPSIPGPDTIGAQLVGPDAPIAGRANAYTFNPLPNADAYRWRQATLGNQFTGEGAEDASPAVSIASSAGYTAIVSGTAATGSRSFHLAHASPERQSVTLLASLFLGATPELTFSQFVGLASPGQTARAEVSADGGANWQSVWSLAGTVTGSASIPKVVFQPATVSLAAYAGRIVQVRFAFDYKLGSSYFPQADKGFGFYIDDIAISDARPLQSIVSTDVSTPSVLFTPSATGTYLLQVQPRYYSELYGEFGPAKVVTAVQAGLAVTGVTRDPQGTLSIDFSVPAGVSSGFTLERAALPAGPWAGVAATAVSNGSGGYRFAGVPTSGTAAFFRVRTP